MQGQKVKALNCQVGLYNHGGWGGQPENLVAVCKALCTAADTESVGIVYNFHHAHDDIPEFANSLKLMQPYLLCLNLNGMIDAEQVVGIETKVLPIGSGTHEQSMIETVIKSGYSGPIGILDHRPDLDSEEALKANLEGLDRLFGGK